MYRRGGWGSTGLGNIPKNTNFLCFLIAKPTRMITICCQILLIALYKLLWLLHLVFMIYIWFICLHSGAGPSNNHLCTRDYLMTPELPRGDMYKIILCTTYYEMTQDLQRGDMHKILSDDSRIAWNRYIRQNFLHNILSDVSKIAN